MFFVPLLAAVFAVPALVSAQQVDNKGSLFGPFDSLHQAIKSRMDSMPNHGVVSANDVPVPQICIDHSTGNGVDDPNTGITCSGLEAKSVQFDDCGEPWTLCRCSNANLGWDSLIDRVSRIPPGARSYVRNVLATNAPGCSGICYDGNFVRLHGDCDMFVLMHEVGHAVDDGYSNWDVFYDKINSDGCVPDDYGKTNDVEEFAQVWAFVTSAWFSGTVPADFGCMKSQFDQLWFDPRIQDALGSPQCNLDVKPDNFAKSAKFGKGGIKSTLHKNVTIPSGLKSIHEAVHFGVNLQ